MKDQLNEVSQKWPKVEFSVKVTKATENIMDKIYEECEDKKLTAAEIIGILEIIKMELIDEARK